MSVSLLDNFSHYLQAQASRPENEHAVRPLAITISREVGAGAGFVRAAEVIAEAGLRHHKEFAEREGSSTVSVE